MSVFRGHRLVVAVSVMIAGVVLPVSLAFGVLDLVSPPSNAGLTATLLESGPPVPVLTLGQRQEAARAIAADPTLRSLVQGTPYKVVQIGPWTDNANLVGAIAEIQLASPIEVDSGVWTVLDPQLPPGSKPPYPTTSVVLSVKNLSGLAVMVDFATDSVVQMTPKLGPAPVGGVAPPPGPEVFVPPGQTIPSGPSENDE